MALAKDLFSANFKMRIDHTSFEGLGLSSQKANILSKYLISDIKNLGGNQPLEVAGGFAAGLIRKRTLKGIDGFGNKFIQLQGKGKRKNPGANYSLRKKRALAKGTIVAPVGSVRPPNANLYFKGTMLHSIGYFKSKQISGVRFGFGITMSLRGSHGKISNKRLAEIHHAGNGRLPARPFMRLMHPEVQRMLIKFKAELRRDLLSRVR